MKQLTKLLLLALLVTLLPAESIAQKSGSKRRKRSSPPAIKKITKKAVSFTGRTTTRKEGMSQAG